ncbi:hypothetical protein ACI2LF_11765 [Kribbella sp. NPDC020789]
MEAFYRRYLERCNQHHFGELSEFVAQYVEINGAGSDVDRYGAGLQSVVDRFPDFHWDRL